MVQECSPSICICDAFRAKAVGGPGHIGEQVAGLHGGDDAFPGETVEVGWEEDLGVLDAEPEGCRGVRRL